MGMTRKPDEIKRGLECCAASYADCHKECPYKPDCDGSQILKDALALIQQLQAENAQQARCIENMTDKLNAMNDEVAKLQAERDAAIEDMTEMAKYGGENCCEWCDQTECECTCADVGIYAGFNWRGVQKEE